MMSPGQLLGQSTVQTRGKATSSGPSLGVVGKTTFLLQPPSFGPLPVLLPLQWLKTLRHLHLEDCSSSQDLLQMEGQPQQRDQTWIHYRGWSDGDSGVLTIFPRGLF